MSRCLACGTPLSSRELTRKYSQYKEIKNPEDQYINLCTSCCKLSGIIDWVDNVGLPDNDSPADGHAYFGEDYCINYDGDEDS